MTLLVVITSCCFFLGIYSLTGNPEASFLLTMGITNAIILPMLIGHAATNKTLQEIKEAIKNGQTKK